MSAAAAQAAARLRIYFREMYPLPQRVLLAALLALGVTRLLARAHARPFEVLSVSSARAAAAVFTLMLILRLMDELKDLEVDRRLFPARPLPAGRVRPADIAGCLALATLAWIALHAGTPAVAALSAALVLLYALAMFRWFFVPAWMRPRLLATLATHTPVVPLLLAHLAVLSASGGGAPRARATAVALIVMQFWAAVFAWEIARKIRSPQEEDDYVTYSRLLGPRAAVALAFGAHVVSVACALVLTTAFGLAPTALALPLAALAYVTWRYAAFLRRPGPATSRLRVPAEHFTLVTSVWGWVA